MKQSRILHYFSFQILLICPHLLLQMPKLLGTKYNYFDPPGNAFGPPTPKKSHSPIAISDTFPNILQSVDASTR